MSVRETVTRELANWEASNHAFTYLRVNRGLAPPMIAETYV